MSRRNDNRAGRWRSENFWHAQGLSQHMRRQHGQDEYLDTLALRRHYSFAVAQWCFGEILASAAETTRAAIWR